MAARDEKMPEGWEERRLGGIFFNICTGKKNNEDKVSNGHYPFFVRSRQIEKINSYSFDGEAIIITIEGLKKRSRRIFPQKAIFMCL
ncbi:MAG: restriction endonuclease subunit S [Treponema sp.]|jgi:hypothetical protein|nr:restriction endonuclease subunit S [Treponema sp.]